MVNDFQVGADYIIHRPGKEYERATVVMVDPLYPDTGMIGAAIYRKDGTTVPRWIGRNHIVLPSRPGWLECLNEMLAADRAKRGPQEFVGATWD